MRMTKIADNYNLTPSARKLLTVLNEIGVYGLGYRCSKNFKYVCGFSYKELAEKVGCTKDTIKNSAQLLDKVGLVEFSWAVFAPTDYPSGEYMSPEIGNAINDYVTKIKGCAKCEDCIKQGHAEILYTKDGQERFICHVNQMSSYPCDKVWHLDDIHIFGRTTIREEKMDNGHTMAWTRISDDARKLPDFWEWGYSYRESLEHHLAYGGEEEIFFKIYGK